MENMINGKSDGPNRRRPNLLRGTILAVPLLLAATMVCGPGVCWSAPVNRNGPATRPSPGSGVKSILLPVPPQADQAPARQTLEATFNGLYRGRINRFTVGQFLQKLGAVENNPQPHPIRCYVALDLAIRLSGTFGFFQYGQSAILRMVTHYQVKREKIEAKFVHLWAASKFLNYYAVSSNLQAIATWASQAVQTGDLAAARQIAVDGLRLALRFNQRKQAAEFRILLTRIHDQRPMLKKYLAAEKRLLTHPDDPKANQIVGLYKIVTEDYVSAGAKYLVRSADPTWREIGKLGVMDFTIQPPMPPAPQLREAKLWWTAAAREKENAYYAMEMRRMARWCFNCAAPLVNQGFVQLLFKGHYHKALKLLNDAIVQASHAKSSRLAAARLAVWNQMAAEIKTLRANFSIAMSAVSAGTATPKLNESIGEYLCFGEGRWKEGLVYLAHAKNTKIRDAARRDKALPVQPAAQVAAGDAWWRLARNATGLEKLNLESRAVYWFNKAMPKLQGRERKRVQYHLLHYQALMKAE